MTWLDIKEIISLHETVINKTGGSHGVLNYDLLESALFAPHAEFYGVEIYPTSASKIARLMFGLINNHAFIDGNKRIGAAAMQSVLMLNGYTLNFDNEKLVLVTLGVASGNVSIDELTEWIETHTCIL